MPANFSSMRFIALVTITLLLCSCVSIRTECAKNYGLSGETLRLVAGKWHNAPKRRDAIRETLWEHLVQKEAPLNAVVELETPDKRTFTATLLTDGVKTDSCTFRIKHRALWLELPAQHTAVPFLWYVIWGWTRTDTALGITANGDLWVNAVDNATVMITSLPTIGGGGGTGVVDLYERAE